MRTLPGSPPTSEVDVALIWPPSRIASPPSERSIWPASPRAPAIAFAKIPERLPLASTPSMVSPPACDVDAAGAAVALGAHREHTAVAQLDVLRRHCDRSAAAGRARLAGGGAERRDAREAARDLECAGIDRDLAGVLVTERLGADEPSRAHDDLVALDVEIATGPARAERGDLAFDEHAVGRERQIAAAAIA